MPIFIVSSSARAAVTPNASALTKSAPAAREIRCFVKDMCDLVRWPLSRGVRSLPRRSRDKATQRACQRLYRGFPQPGAQRSGDGAAELITARRPAPGGASSLGGAVADARLGLDDSGRGRVAFDLSPELADEDAQILRILGVRGAPDGRQDLAMGDDASRIAKKDRQKLIFLRRQLDRRAVAGDQPLVEVHHDPVDLNPLSRLRHARPVTERGSQASRQFANAERLLDIVVSAEVERLDLLRFPVARRKDDHGRLRKRPDI